jgi:ABC-type branched-subunit amino acid transport system ATPase component
MVAKTTSLELRDVTFAYGGIKALDNCSLTVERQTITGLVGPNGAGKSTLIEVVCGALRPHKGKVVFDGKDIGGLARNKVARLGVIRTFQISKQFATLPVIENMLIAAPGQLGEMPLRAILYRRGWVRQEEELRVRARALLEWIGMSGTELQPAGTLSGGQRRLLDIARALMGKPKLLLLDEPTAGVYPVMAKLIAQRLRELPSLGVTVLLIAHDMEFIEGTCDEVIAMAQGRVLTRGTMAFVRESPELLQAYLGG